jgi:3-hydroxyacyl-CoA dehydrogenase
MQIEVPPIYSQNLLIVYRQEIRRHGKIATVDWIIEVVVERLDIKISFLNKWRSTKPGTLITSNTSGIPIHFMSEGRSEDFQKHFCGTHF